MELEHLVMHLSRESHCDPREVRAELTSPTLSRLVYEAQQADIRRLEDRLEQLKKDLNHD